MESLQKGPMNVSGLADLLHQEQSMISHNLKLLEKCHFISSEKRGKEKYVSLNLDIIDPLFELVENHHYKYCKDKDNCV